MDISVTPDFERAVLERVRRGMYGSVQEVLEAMEDALEERELGAGDNVEALRLAISVGSEQIARGEFLDGEEAMAQLRAERPAAAG